MQTADNPMRLIRSEITALLPQGATLRRDRGDALLTTNASVSLPGYVTRSENGITYISPTERHMTALEERHPEPTGELSASALRFRGEIIDAPRLTMFIRALKLLDAPQVGQIISYDRDLRRAIAVTLRQHAPGGGIYALCLLDEMLMAWYNSSNRI